METVHHESKRRAKKEQGINIHSMTLSSIAILFILSLFSMLFLSACAQQKNTEQEQLQQQYQQQGKFSTAPIQQEQQKTETITEIQTEIKAEIQTEKQNTLNKQNSQLPMQSQPTEEQQYEIDDKELNNDNLDAALTDLDEISY
jgi:Na+-transporting NADH:ubiquinone oxidoreductase subunit NqrC